MRRTETVPPALAGERVDRAVALVCGLPRSAVEALIAEGAVRLDGAPVASRSRRVAAGEVLEVDLAPEGERPPCPPDPSVGVPVVYADDHVVVVDKPAGLVVHPGAGHDSGTLVQGLLARYPELAGVGDPERPGVVHRLDAGTSGLLVVARTPAALASLSRQLAERATFERRYLALVWGAWEHATGVIDAPVGRGERDRTRMAVSARGRAARTRFELRSTFGRPAPVSLLACRLETGRTHQVRVHLAAVGHPVVGDERYGGVRPAIPLHRPFLHACALAFAHPSTAETVRFESPLPADLAAVLASLGPT